MSIFCTECGTDLPDDAKFCWNCGRSQKSGILSNEPQWEVCDIQHKYVNSLKRRALMELPLADLFVANMVIFEAKATGSKGVYIAARSKEFKHSGGKEWEHAKDTFINELVKDDWEPVPGSNPQQFRRRAK